MRFIPTQNILMDLRDHTEMDHIKKARAEKPHAENPGSFDPAWDAVERHLQSAKRAVTDEIRHYPQPIAGCDAQIPALWDKRDALVAEMQRLTASRQAATINAANAIEAFVATSNYIDDATAATIKADLDRHLRAVGHAVPTAAE